MKILFAGTPDAAVPSLKALAQDFDVVAVLTRKDAVRGRGRIPTPSPVKEAAEELGIPVFDAKPDDPDFLATLSRLHVDAAVVVAYGRILRQRVLDAVPLGWFNVHFSVLPHWRGAAPVQRAIWSSDTSTGISIFRLDAGMDTGKLLLTTKEPIEGEPTSGELMEKLANEGATQIVKAMHLVARAAYGESEEPADSSALADTDALEALLRDQPALDDPARGRANKVTEEEAHADFTLPASVASAHIRACIPDPGAWGMLHNGGAPASRLRLNAVRTVPREDPAFLDACQRAGIPVSGSGTEDRSDSAGGSGLTFRPGLLLVTKKHVYVLCGAPESFGASHAQADPEAVELLNVTAPGKRAMRAADWARGARLVEGAWID